MDVKSMVYEYKEELLSRLGKLISINSVEGTPEPDAPFGKGPKVALETALEMMKADGFDTVNLDNYIGYAEIGSGEKLIGIIGHLDVVPANVKDGWDSDPFEMVEKDGVLYGRGVSDDKGAMVASMIALKVIKDMNVPLTKRIRLIFGTNEETGSKCLKHYVEKEGSVDYGFTPDGDFPGVHGEKGMISMRYLSKHTTIKDIQGGSAKNIVCRNCYVVIDKNSFSRKTLEDYFNNENLEFSIENVGENWNEANQEILARFKQVDFVKYAYPHYVSTGQLKEYNQFLLGNVEGAYIFYDPENETKLNYLYRMMLEKETFYVKRLSFDDLNDFAENFYEN